MTPLEKKMNEINRVCCNTCRNKVLIENTNYCKESGKIILSLHLDINREKQCKEKFIRGNDLSIK